MATILPTHEVVAPKLVGVNLHLSVEEAEALQAVLAKVGGDPHVSRRGLVQRIFDGLDEVGVGYDSSDIDATYTTGLWFESTAN